MKEEMTGYPSVDKPWLKAYPEGITQKNCPEKTMYRFIYENNAKRLDNVAMNYFDRKIMYREMFEKIEKTANALAANGVKAGDIVSIISLNTPETVYCLYALNKIGAVANLILANITTNEIVESLNNTNSKLLIVLDKILEKLGDIECDIPVVVLSLGESAGGFVGFLMKLSAKRNRRYSTFKNFISIERTEYKEATDANAPAIIVYTSGSTGTPKGVLLSNNNLNSCAWQCYLSGKNYQTHESFLNILPPFISFGIGMMHLCFFTGMTELICIVPQVENIHKMLKKYKPERFVVGPAITDAVEKYDGELTHLIDLTGGGGAISLEKERLINNILSNKNAKSMYLAGYGMTELSSAVAMNRNDHCKEQSIGLPLPFTNMKVVDLENGKELGYGSEGELLVSAPGLMLEYYKNPEESEKVIEFDEGVRWLRTGDLAKIDEEGYVFITGRIKRIYITKDATNMAYKLFPQHMEDVISECLGVEKCGVIVIPDDERQNIPVVFITVSNNQTGNVKSEVMKIISEKLPSYYLPKAINLIENMPTTSSQKIDYRELERIATTHC